MPNRKGTMLLIHLDSRRALNALTDRNKTKILIFFASFVRKKNKATTTKNTTKQNQQTNKQKKKNYSV